MEVITRKNHHQEDAMKTLVERCEMSVLDETGDTKLIWDPDKQDEVDAAKELFAKMKKKGYLAYKVDRKGEKGEVIDEFGRYAEKIIMAPQMKGG